MSILTENLQPMIEWIRANPEWALLLAFLISLGESLAVVGTLIPGSLTMTAVGVLAGSGVIRVDLTLLVAALGAIAGDSLSYLLGRQFHDRIPHIWPFRNNPSWLKYGQAFFERHGSKSVVLGRFIGPLRAVIPVIAGMMRMNHWHFMIANIISGISWSFLYVLPGVFIGIAASSDLAAGDTRRMLIVVVGALVSLWLLSMLVKFLYFYGRSFLQTFFRNSVAMVKKHAAIRDVVLRLTPIGGKKYRNTIMLLLTLIGGFILAAVMLAIDSYDGFAAFDNLVYDIAANFRAPFFNCILISLALLLTNFSLCILFFGIAVYFILVRDYVSLRYWGLLGIIALVTGILTRFVSLELNDSKWLYDPEVNMVVFTSMIGFLIGFIEKARSFWRISLYVLIFAVAFALLYLGDILFSEMSRALLSGFLLVGIFRLFYRLRISHRIPPYTILYLAALLMTAFGVSLLVDYDRVLRQHKPVLSRQMTTNAMWWSPTPAFPVQYSVNTFGKERQKLNIQYAGDINRLITRLTASGWKIPPNSLLYRLMLHAGGQSLYSLPMVNQRYHNKKPLVVLTYNHEGRMLVLNLWLSGYYIKGADGMEVLLLGSLYDRNGRHEVDDFALMRKSLPGFEFLLHGQSGLLLIRDSGYNSASEKL